VVPRVEPEPRRQPSLHHAHRAAHFVLACDRSRPS
jgi:hypothetical protein